MSALVVHSQGNKSQAIIRSLGRRGIKVVATDSSRFAAGFYSRYCTDHLVTPSPQLYPEEFIRTILDRVKQGDIDVLIPSNSTETLLISKYKDRFEPYTHVPFMSFQKLFEVHNKETLHALAYGLGIPVPWTFAPQTMDDVRNISKKVSYPVVIKPKKSTSSQGVMYAQSDEECLAIFKRYGETARIPPDELPLIQEYIPGDGYGVSVLFNKGELRAFFTHKRLREFPLTGGPSTLRESVRNPQMERIAIDLMKACGWHGVAMVEFKLHRETLQPYLIEVNPRFWGSVNHAIVSGVDFPYLLYTMAVKGDVPPVLDYRIGIKTRFLFNDLRALYAMHKKKKDLLALFSEVFARYPSDEFAWDDPLPFMIYFGHKMAASFHKKATEE